MSIYHTEFQVNTVTNIEVKRQNALIHARVMVIGVSSDLKCHPRTMQCKRSCNAFLLNIILVSCGEVEIEISLSDRVKPLQQNYIFASGRLASTVFLSV